MTGKESTELEVGFNFETLYFFHLLSVESFESCISKCRCRQLGQRSQATTTETQFELDR